MSKRKQGEKLVCGKVGGRRRGVWKKGKVCRKENQVNNEMVGGEKLLGGGKECGRKFVEQRKGRRKKRGCMEKRTGRRTNRWLS